MSDDDGTVGWMMANHTATRPDCPNHHLMMMTPAGFKCPTCGWTLPVNCEADDE
jgi:hypothetical protein